MASYGDRESILRLAQPDVEFVAFMHHLLENLPKEGFPDMSNPDTARFFRQMEDKGRRDALPSLPVDESTMLIPMRDEYMNEVRIFKPKSISTSTARPLVVLVYGGGFITGDNNSATPFALPIATTLDAVVVNISYRMTPEYKFPTQANDVWDTLKWLAENASALGADTSAGFVLGGESAGGNVAAVGAIRAMKEALAAPLTGLWLSVPWLLNECPKGYEDIYLAREQNKDAPLINDDLLKMVTGMWHPDFASSDFSPFNSPNVVDGNHPPTYIQVCGMDPLRDDGLVYERVLSVRGVSTKVDVYPGVPHAHWAMSPYIKSSQKSMLDGIVGVGWLLGKDAPIAEIKESLGKLAADI